VKSDFPKSQKILWYIPPKTGRTFGILNIQAFGGAAIMHKFNDNWDGIQRKQQINEEALGMKYFTDMDDLAKDIVEYAKTLKGKKNIGGFTPEQAALHQIAGALRQGHEQMLHFFDGLIYHLESIHKKTMSPSKHGNMEIMNSLSMVIRELKKYKK